MTARIIALAEGLKDHLETQLGKTVYRRYVPYLTNKEVQLKEERISVFPSDDSNTLTSRTFDTNTFEIGVEVAQTLPESGDQNRINPDADINQLDFLDARMQTIDDIKDLFRDEGPLREVYIGDCYYSGLEQAQLYSADALIQDRLFSSILRISFQYAGSA